MANFEQRRQSWKQRNRIYIYAAVIALVMTMFVAPEVMEGDSMEPAISDGDVTVLSKESYSAKRGRPDLGDVVVLEKPYSQQFAEDNLILRVVGIPGDEISIDRGKLYRNGREYEGPGSDGHMGQDMDPVRVDKDSVFLLCDNREEEDSIDSRNEKMGLVPMKEIRGKVRIIVWPFDRLGGIDK